MIIHSSIWVTNWFSFGSLTNLCFSLRRWKREWHYATWLLRLEARTVLFQLIIPHISILRYFAVSPIPSTAHLCVCTHVHTLKTYISLGNNVLANHIFISCVRKRQICRMSQSIVMDKQGSLQSEFLVLEIAYCKFLGGIFISHIAPFSSVLSSLSSFLLILVTNLFNRFVAETFY